MNDTFDFMALGQAIKKAREAKGMTREQLAEILDVAPRHLQSIENEGQYPSFPLFARLVTMFNISADQYLFADKQVKKRPYVGRLIPSSTPLRTKNSLLSRGLQKPYVERKSQWSNPLALLLCLGLFSFVMWETFANIILQTTISILQSSPR